MVDEKNILNDDLIIEDTGLDEEAYNVIERLYEGTFKDLVNR